MCSSNGKTGQVSRPSQTDTFPKMELPHRTEYWEAGRGKEKGRRVRRKPLSTEAFEKPKLQPTYLLCQKTAAFIELLRSAHCSGSTWQLLRMAGGAQRGWVGGAGCQGHGGAGCSLYTAGVCRGQGTVALNVFRVQLCAGDPAQTPSPSLSPAGVNAQGHATSK